MKLKVILADQDENYVKKFLRCVENNYFDEIELAVFTTKETLENYLEKNPYDSILYTEHFVEVNKRGMCFLLRDDRETAEEDDVRALCKYQKVEHIYKSILRAHAESKSNFKSQITKKDGQTQIITFLSASGGAGKSVCAATFARLQAMSGKMVLYLSIEKIPSTEELFEADGGTSLSQVMFWVKRGKGNIPMKIESSLVQDYSGVYFWKSGQNPMELADMDTNDWKELLQQIIELKKMDYIVIDTESPISNEMADILKLSDRLVCICTEDETNQNKTKQLVKGFEVMERQFDIPFLTKCCAVINYGANMQNLPEQVGGIPVLGGVWQMPKGMVGRQMSQMIIENHQGDGLYKIV